MIKRYGYGQKSIRVSGNTNINIPDLVERDDGDYVRYEDYVAVLESIGAGGVKGQLMRKELSDDVVGEIKAMADIRLVDGKAELSNVREIAHAITRGCNE